MPCLFPCRTCIPMVFYLLPLHHQVGDSLIGGTGLFACLLPAGGISQLSPGGRDFHLPPWVGTYLCTPALGFLLPCSGLHCSWGCFPSGRATMPPGWSERGWWAGGTWWSGELCDCCLHHLGEPTMPANSALLPAHSGRRPVVLFLAGREVGGGGGGHACHATCTHCTPYFLGISFLLTPGPDLFPMPAWEQGEAPFSSMEVGGETVVVFIRSGRLGGGRLATALHAFPIPPDKPTCHFLHSVTCHGFVSTYHHNTNFRYFINSTAPTSQEPAPGAAHHHLPACCHPGGVGCWFPVG